MDYTSVGSSIGTLGGMAAAAYFENPDLIIAGATAGSLAGAAVQKYRDKHKKNKEESYDEIPDKKKKNN